MSETRLSHRPPDANARGVMWFGLGLSASLALIALLVYVFLRMLTAAHPSAAGWSRNMNPRVAVPPPQLESDPSRDLAEIRTREEKVLNSYGWVDRSKGVIRIPIERAIELTAQRGLPARSPQPAAKP
jgi:hypothetical protein